MRRGSAAVWWRSAEFVYASSALFVLTQGPVYRLWSPSAGVVSRLAEPSVSEAHLATFMIAQLPGVALWLRRLEPAWLRERSNLALTAFIGWLGLSVMWSAFARQSLPEFVALVFTTTFGLYLASSFSVRELWAVVGSAMALGVGSSWIAVMRLWEGAINFQEDYWTGLYYNRNSLAPVAAVAIVSVVGVLMTSLNDLSHTSVRWRLVVTVAVSSLLCFSVIELWQSKSKTSPIALVVAILTCLAWLSLRAVFDRVPPLRRFTAQSLPLTLIVLGVGMVVALRVVGSSEALSSDLTTLSSRRSLWSLSWDGILVKPLLGWGWMAAWRTPEFFRSGEWWAAWNSVWSHNGYHDVLLGGGFVAGILLALLLFLGSANVGRRSAKVALPQVGLIVFILVAATQESFFIGSHFAWALLVAMLFAPRRAVLQSTSSTPAR